MTSSPSPVEQWFPYRRSTGQERFRLFCFPFAGGVASMYRAWQAEMPVPVSVCAVQYPGREQRIDAPMHPSIPALVEHLVPAMQPLLDRPFALFGHSFGGITAFETARALRRKGLPMPAALFIGGSRPPQTMHHREALSHLSDRQFIEEVRSFGGTPPGAFEDPELLELVLPILRNDFRALDSYRYDPEPPLSCPIHIFAGSRDTMVPVPTARGWASQTSGSVRMHAIDDGHFFVLDNRTWVTRIVAGELTTLIENNAPSTK